MAKGSTASSNGPLRRESSRASAGAATASRSSASPSSVPCGRGEKVSHRARYPPTASPLSRQHAAADSRTPRSGSVQAGPGLSLRGGCSPASRAAPASTQSSASGESPCASSTTSDPSQTPPPMPAAQAAGSVRCHWRACERKASARPSPARAHQGQPPASRAPACQKNGVSAANRQRAGSGPPHRPPMTRETTCGRNAPRNSSAAAQGSMPASGPLSPVQKSSGLSTSACSRSQNQTVRAPARTAAARYGKRCCRVDCMAVSFFMHGMRTLSLFQDAVPGGKQKKYLIPDK